MSDQTNKTWLTRWLIQRKQLTYPDNFDVFGHIKLWILNQSLSLYIQLPVPATPVRHSISIEIRKTWSWLVSSPTLKRTVPFGGWYRWDPRPPSPVEQHNLKYRGHFVLLYWQNGDNYFHLVTVEYNDWFKNKAGV